MATASWTSTSFSRTAAAAPPSSPRRPPSALLLSPSCTRGKAGSATTPACVSSTMPGANTSTALK
ncbi:hypothetical protein AL705_05520 [Lawsonella clevelandensis]|uniref:Uncharacterized protein n=1 Tax=Lawsonella clevelandensis TaxID=1528099 RepID=A0A0M4MXZ0_9ACTN|nr:hypothetical protein AL705_05520 [Lawsonella clevelandensis]